MSSILNNGGQVLTFDYKQEGTSQGFNRLFYKVLPMGIISGGDLIRVSDTSVKISPMVAIFEDPTSRVSVRIETTEDAVVTVSNATPYVIARFKWLNVEDNFIEFTSASYTSIEDNTMIIGKCLYKSDILTGFDFTRKKWSTDHFINSEHLNFNVTPTEPESLMVNVDSGSAIIGGKVVKFDGGKVAINGAVSKKRIDIISIDRNGKIIVTEGLQDNNPVMPLFPSNMLTVASVSLGSNPSTIKGDMITNYYNSNFIQADSNFKISEVISKTETREIIQENSKFIIEGTQTALTLGSATFKGCEIRIYSNIDGGKINLRTPNKIYTLRKGEYIHLLWNGTKWEDLIQSTTWDLRNNGASIPLSANLDDYVTSGTWKNAKMKGIKGTPTEIIQAEESADDGKSYSTIIVEEADEWIKQYIHYTVSAQSPNNGSGHYTVTRGGLKNPDGHVSWSSEWTRVVSEKELTNGTIQVENAKNADLATNVKNGAKMLPKNQVLATENQLMDGTVSKVSPTATKDITSTFNEQSILNLAEIVGLYSNGDIGSPMDFGFDFFNPAPSIYNMWYTFQNQVASYKNKPDGISPFTVGTLIKIRSNRYSSIYVYIETGRVYSLYGTMYPSGRIWITHDDGNRNLTWVELVTTGNVLSETLNLQSIPIIDGSYKNYKTPGRYKLLYGSTVADGPSNILAKSAGYLTVLSEGDAGGMQILNLTVTNDTRVPSLFIKSWEPHGWSAWQLIVTPDIVSGMISGKLDSSTAESIYFRKDHMSFDSSTGELTINLD